MHRPRGGSLGDQLRLGRGAGARRPGLPKLRPDASAGPRRAARRLDQDTAHFGGAKPRPTVLCRPCRQVAAPQGGFWLLRSVTVMDRCLLCAWNDPWNRAPDNRSAASAVSAMTRIICAAPECGRAVPRCVPSAASGPGRTRLPSRARRPGPPPSFYDRPGLLTPPGNLLLIPLRRAAGRDLHTPPDPVQQHIHPRQRVLHPEPPPDLIRHPGQRPALIRIPGRRRTRIQHRFQLGDLGRGELAFRAASTLGRQRLPATRSQPPAPPVRAHPRDPEPLRDLPVAGPGLARIVHEAVLLVNGRVAKESNRVGGHVMWQTGMGSSFRTWTVDRFVDRVAG